MKKIYATVFHLDEGGYIARVPAIPGCAATGKTLEDAIERITDVAHDCLCGLEDISQPLPEEILDVAAEMEPGDKSTLLVLDTTKYRRMTDTKAVPKTVSMPAWMAAEAARRRINLSKVLQEALYETLG